MPEHKHIYVYGGVKYLIGDLLMGSDAHQVEYYDWYYCSGCLIEKYKKLSTGARNSYQPILFNATPMNETSS